MASAKLTIALDHNTPHHPLDTKPHRRLQFTFLHRLPTKKYFTILCNSSKKASAELEFQEHKNPPLSEQLKTLSTVTISDQPNQSHRLFSKPKPTWINPAKPRPSVLSLERHKRPPFPQNSKIKDMRLFAKEVNQCGSSEASFLAVLEKIPHPPTPENALLVLHGLKPWKKTLLFVKWLKTQNLFPMETIFYNVTMKSLRSGGQFKHIENLAFEMIENGIELDNVTYSTIISCAKKCNLFDKALEWFERMYKTGLMPDEVTYSVILDVYAKLDKVEEVKSLYERGRASGWKPDHIAFTVLAKMFGELGNYDDIKFVMKEMKSLGVRPNLVLYNALLRAIGNAGMANTARYLFEEMVDSGVAPNEKTLTAMIKIYTKARWATDALGLYKRMRSNSWPMDLIVYNTLLSMCAEFGLEPRAEHLLEEMKGSKKCRPDSWSYAAMFRIYGSGGNVEKAMVLLNEMSTIGVHLNVMGCTCLIRCLGRAKKIDDLVSVLETSVKGGIKPDDKLSCCLLSILSSCEGDDADKVLGCLEQSNPKLVAFVKLLDEESTTIDIMKQEFKIILTDTEPGSRNPLCNCLIDIYRNRNLNERAHELLYVGTMYGLYPSLHRKSATEWRLNLRSLSVGAAKTAFEEWMSSIGKIVEREEMLPPVFMANTGTGTHRLALGLGAEFASHVEKLAAPFRESEDRAGVFVATREDLTSWLQSKGCSPDPVATTP